MPTTITSTANNLVTEAQLARERCLEHQASLIIALKEAWQDTYERLTDQYKIPPFTRHINETVNEVKTPQGIVFIWRKTNGKTYSMQCKATAGRLDYCIPEWQLPIEMEKRHKAMIKIYNDNQECLQDLAEWPNHPENPAAFSWGNRQVLIKWGVPETLLK